MFLSGMNIFLRQQQQPNSLIHKNMGRRSTVLQSSKRNGRWNLIAWTLYSVKKSTVCTLYTFPHTQKDETTKKHSLPKSNGFTRGIWSPLSRFGYPYKVLPMLHIPLCWGLFKLSDITVVITTDKWYSTKWYNTIQLFWKVPSLKVVKHSFDDQSLSIKGWLTANLDAIDWPPMLLYTTKKALIKYC